MEGVYENFPEMHHGAAFFSSQVSPQILQKILFRLFYRINMGEETVDMPIFVSRGIQLMPEIGIAENLSFSFIDEEEKKRWLDKVEKKAFEILDFIWIARYYISEEGKNKPLKFDYYMLRFIFGSEAMELRVHHERGTRRLPIEDLIRLIGEKINQELAREGEQPLRLKSLRAF